MGQDDTNGGPFSVKDKRHFNPDGSVREEGDEKEAQPSQAEQNKKNVSEEPAKKEEEQTTPPPPPKDFEINFSTFILSLASSVQINLGLIPHPMTKKSEVDLVSAKQTIDIIGMMEEKTKGNLTKEEEQILNQILYELRMQYLEVSKKQEKN